MTASRVRRSHSRDAAASDFCRHGHDAHLDRARIARLEIFVFAVIALIARSGGALPHARGTQSEHARSPLISAFGPRGLSSLLLALLPVFAGIPNADRSLR